MSLPWKTGLKKRIVHCFAPNKRARARQRAQMTTSVQRSWLARLTVNTSSSTSCPLFAGAVFLTLSAVRSGATDCIAAFSLCGALAHSAAACEAANSGVCSDTWSIRWWWTLVRTLSPLLSASTVITSIPDPSLEPTSAVGCITFSKDFPAARLRFLADNWSSDWLGKGRREGGGGDRGGGGGGDRGSGRRVARQKEREGHCPAVARTETTACNILTEIKTINVRKYFKICFHLGWRRRFFNAAAFLILALVRWTNKSLWNIKIF